MNYLVTLFLGLYFCTLVPSTDQEKFLQANAAYQHQEFEKALEIYDSIDAKGPAVWYNMGNASYHMQDVYNAHIYWQRAARGGVSSITRSALKNCEYVFPEQYAKGKFSLFRFLKRECMSIAIGSWQIGASLLLLLIIIVLFMFGFRYVWLIVGVTTPAIFTISLCFFSYKLYQPLAFALQDTVCLYAGPDDKFHVISTVKRGEEVRLCSTQKEKWLKVHSHGKNGWVKYEDIQLV